MNLDQFTMLCQGAHNPGQDFILLAITRGHGMNARREGFDCGRIINSIMLK